MPKTAGSLRWWRRCWRIGRDSTRWRSTARIPLEGHLDLQVDSIRLGGEVDPIADQFPALPLGHGLQAYGKEERQKPRRSNQPVPPLLSLVHLISVRLLKC